MSTGIINISQDIISLIVLYLQPRDNPSNSLSAYANISRAWQHAIERHTFRRISVRSSEMEEFSRIMVGPRQNLLKRLEFDVILPAYPDKARAKFETEEEKQVNDRVFTKAIKDLFALLRSWHDDHFRTNADGGGDDAPVERSFDLCLRDCYSPSDDGIRGWKSSVRTWRRKIGCDLSIHRYESSVVRLESIEGFPEVPQISHFSKAQSVRQIEPRSLAMIASKLPSLNSFLWGLWDNEKRRPRIRQQRRFGGLISPGFRIDRHLRSLSLTDKICSNLIEFAEALSMIPRGSLKRVVLGFYNRPPNDQELNPARALTLWFPTTDHLSLAIHQLSRTETLTHLELWNHIVISPSLFWPEHQAEPPSWPNLVSVKVQFNMSTADGDWYFMRRDFLNVDSEDCSAEVDSDDYEGYHDFQHSGSDDPDVDENLTIQYADPDKPDTYKGYKLAFAIGDRPLRQFRSRADPDKLDPLFKAVAQAAAHMPRLQRMTLVTKVEGSKYFTFTMTYLAVGERTDRWPGSTMNVEMPRLIWEIGSSQYEPEESTLQIWRRAKGEDVMQIVEKGFVGEPSRELVFK